jgi:hypothetical protein
MSSKERKDRKTDPTLKAVSGKGLKKRTPTSEQLALQARATLEITLPPSRAGKSPQPDALGEALVERGIIDRFQLFQALQHSYNKARPLGDALVELGYADQPTIDRAAQELEAELKADGGTEGPAT